MNMDKTQLQWEDEIKTWPDHPADGAPLLLYSSFTSKQQQILTPPLPTDKERIHTLARLPREALKMAPSSLHLQALIATAASLFVSAPLFSVYIFVLKIFSLKMFCLVQHFFLLNRRDVPVPCAQWVCGLYYFKWKGWGETLTAAELEGTEKTTHLGHLYWCCCRTQGVNTEGFCWHIFTRL